MCDILCLSVCLPIDLLSLKNIIHTVCVYVCLYIKHVGGRTWARPLEWTKTPPLWPRASVHSRTRTLAGPMHSIPACHAGAGEMTMRTMC